MKESPTHGGYVVRTFRLFRGRPAASRLAVLALVAACSGGSTAAPQEIPPAVRFDFETLGGAQVVGSGVTSFAAGTTPDLDWGYASGVVSLLRITATGTATVELPVDLDPGPFDQVVVRTRFAGRQIVASEITIAWEGSNQVRSAAYQPVEQVRHGEWLVARLDLGSNGAWKGSGRIRTIAIDLDCGENPTTAEIDFVVISP